MAALDETGATPEGNSENEETLNPCDSPLARGCYPCLRYEVDCTP